MLHDSFALLIIFSSLILLLYITHLAIQKFALSAEVSRKSVHVLMGLTVTLFPFIFEHTITVWILALLSLILFYTIKHVKRAERNLADALYRIKRKSFGEVYYTLGVAISFTLAQNNYEYITAILLLTFSDAIASLIGIKYGTSFMSFMGNKKSVQGSLAFFTSSFIIVYITSQSLLIALNVSLILTLLEALSIKGLDNILIPVVAIFLLQDYAHATLVQHLLSIALFWLALRILFKRYHTFKVRSKKESVKILVKCKVVASATLYDNHYFGDIQSDSALNLERLLKALTKRHSHLIGPINGSTWQSYRIVTESDDSAPFMFEPNNPLYYNDVFLKCGFSEAAHYISSKTPLHSAQDSRVSRVKERLEKNAIKIRSINLEAFKEELIILHQLSNEVFKNNYLFTPISQEEFLALYMPFQTQLAPELCQMVFKENELLGYMFAFIEGKNLIIKTTAFKPLKITAGTTLVLLDNMANFALKNGCDTMIYALMHEDNHSAKIAHKNATVFREYVLMQYHREA